MLERHQTRLVTEAVTTDAAVPSLWLIEAWGWSRWIFFLAI